MALMLCANSLLVGAALVVCFVNTGVHPAFQLDEFGDVIFEDPAIAGPEDYQATEGNYVFCCVSYRYFSPLNSFSFCIQRSFILVLYFLLACPPWGCWVFKVPRLLFKFFFML